MCQICQYICVPQVYYQSFIDLSNSVSQFLGYTFLRLHMELSVSGRIQLCNGCQRNPDIICGPALKMDVFLWSEEKYVCGSEISWEVAFCTSHQMPALPFFVDNSKIK